MSSVRAAEPRSCFYDIERYLNYQITPFKIIQDPYSIIFYGLSVICAKKAKMMNALLPFGFELTNHPSTSLSLPLSFLLFLFLSLLSFSHFLTLASSFFLPSLSLFSPSHILTYSLYTPFLSSIIPISSLFFSPSLSHVRKRVGDRIANLNVIRLMGQLAATENTAKDDC